MKLTKPQARFLDNANDCTPPHEYAVRHDFSGIIAKGADRKCAARLEELGLVSYLTTGPETDGDHDKEWPIYTITDAGRALLTKGATK